MNVVDTITHLRAWAETRSKLASSLMRVTTIDRQRWQKRGQLEELRDLLHHLDSLERELGEST